MKNNLRKFYVLRLTIVMVWLLNCTTILLAQWVNTNGPGNNLIAYSLTSSGTNLFAGTYSGVYRSSNGGTNWIAVNNGLPAIRVYAVVFSGEYLLAGTLLGGAGIFRTTNNGANWTASNNGLTNLNVTTIAVFGNYLFAGTLSGNFRSTNNGDSWTTIGSTGSAAYDFVMSGSNLFAGTYGSGVYRSTNNGTSWTAVNNGLPNLSLYTLLASEGNLYAGLEYTGVGSFYRSSNSGMNWISINSGIPESRGHSLFSYGSNIIAGTYDSDIFISANQGTDWTSISEGFSNASALTFFIYNNNLFAGTYGDGVWRRPLSEIISVQNISTENPDQFDLKQNYPNPFNPVTYIEFSIPKQYNVKITVYDSQGKEVADLLNERLSAGSFRVDFDGTGFSSGIYFYKMETEDFVQTKSMVLLK